jgi:hypothetical protein
MPIPGPVDAVLSELEDLHSVILVRLRTWHHAGSGRDPQAVRAALRQYIDVAMGFVNGDDGE